ncbi:hypothetical protein [Nostoc sp. 2RC]|uniref:hypothetical protein n=1 Tax=Nostoc sp. 2RC TaxID=2485484 RepID=UPI0016259C40|nr:hypothetical protein [Nostoc sp. 2RC]
MLITPMGWWTVYHEFVSLELRLVTQKFLLIGTNTPKKSNLIFRKLQVKNVPLLLLTVDHSQLTNNSQPPEAEEFLFWISLKPISRGNR